MQQHFQHFPSCVAALRYLGSSVMTFILLFWVTVPSLWFSTDGNYEWKQWIWQLECSGGLGSDGWSDVIALRAFSNLNDSMIKRFSNIRRLSNSFFFVLICKEVQQFLMSASPANTVAMQFHGVRFHQNSMIFLAE